MGTIQHHSLVVVGDAPMTQSLRTLAKRMAEQNGLPDVVTDVVEVVNSYCTFSILPCGSKMGFPSYSAHLDLIEQVVRLCELSNTSYSVSSFGELGNFSHVIRRSSSK